MAGHSKFKNIQYRKGAQDAKRSKMFSKFSKEITVAAKMGDPDPESNPRLRLAIQIAKGQSMPKDNITRAIQKAVGGDAEHYDELRYEGYGPGGVALMVEALTDNRNRSGSSVRTIFSKAGGNLGESGSVGFMFDHVGEVIFAPDVADADTMFEAALEAGAEEVESDEDGHIVYTQSTELHNVLGALKDVITEDPISAKLIFKGKDPMPLDLDMAQKTMNLIEKLEDDDDVQNVYGNFDISDEVAEQLE